MLLRTDHSREWRGGGGEGGGGQGEEVCVRCKSISLILQSVPLLSVKMILRSAAMLLALLCDPRETNIHCHAISSLRLLSLSFSTLMMKGH